MSVIGSNIIAGASGVVAETGYQIARSLRFNSADSASLTRTPAGAGSRTTWTFSGWLKRTVTGADTFILSANGGTSNDLILNCYINSSDKFVIDSYTNTYRVSTRVFRDVGAPMHVHIVWDTNNATAQSRARVWINNEEITAWDTNATISSGQLGGINGAYAHAIGRREGANDKFFSGYLYDMRMVDGQALTPSSFGETDSATGVWVPKAYTGTYGTNGFWLKLDDNSGTTSTTLGKDSSGNGNNWTPNNFSVTAGTGNDSLVDSPTNYGTDTGAGGEVRGNYATWNPLWTNVPGISNGNLDVTGPDNTAMATIGMSSGKWYFETTITNVGAISAVGLCATQPGSTNYPGYLSDGYCYISTGNKQNNNSTAAYGATYTTGDVIGCAFDADAGTLTFYKNGVSQGAAYSSIPSKTYYFAVYGRETTTANDLKANFGQRPFAYTAPSGFKALCTQNLPTPAIGASSTTLADDYFNVVTYTGTGSSLSVTGVGFQPDLVWIKGRSGATDHALYDAVRGVQKQLESNTTTDETTETTGLTAFGTDGFTVGALAQLNTSSATYVGWNWKESATSGFDIVTYTGNGANRTISHGLGVAPKMVIVKARTTAGADTGWPVWHTGIANTNYIDLNGSAASTSGTTYWNSTSPTSSVFSVGTAAAVNTNNDTYVAYLFAEVEGFSKFGSYTGNGSTNGVFLYCGFSPRYVMVKQTDAVGNWIIWDTARSTFNQSQKYVVTNGTAAVEGDLAAVAIDILSNGFKCRTTDNDINGNTNTYIFAAFAEFPFQYARAR